MVHIKRYVIFKTRLGLFYTMCTKNGNRTLKCYSALNIQFTEIILEQTERPRF